MQLEDFEKDLEALSSLSLMRNLSDCHHPDVTALIKHIRKHKMDRFVGGESNDLYSAVIVLNNVGTMDRKYAYCLLPKDSPDWFVFFQDESRKYIMSKAKLIPNEINSTEYLAHPYAIINEILDKLPEVIQKQILDSI